VSLKACYFGGSAINVVGVEEKKRTEGDHKFRQPIWCPHGLNKTQRCKLQRARHKQQKREKLAKMEGEIFNPIHVKIPLKDQNVIVVGQSALTGSALESA
jgi:hypothetical protein